MDNINRSVAQVQIDDGAYNRSDTSDSCCTLCRVMLPVECFRTVRFRATTVIVASTFFGFNGMSVRRSYNRNLLQRCEHIALLLKMLGEQRTVNNRSVRDAHNIVSLRTACRRRPRLRLDVDVFKNRNVEDEK